MIFVPSSSPPHLEHELGLGPRARDAPARKLLRLQQSRVSGSGKMSARDHDAYQLIAVDRLREATQNKQQAALGSTWQRLCEKVRKPSGGLAGEPQQLK